MIVSLDIEPKDSGQSFNLQDIIAHNLAKRRSPVPYGAHVTLDVLKRGSIYRVIEIGLHASQLPRNRCS
jgi:hypothetical protein